MSRQKLLEKFEQFVNKKTQQMRRVLDLDREFKYLSGGRLFRVLEGGRSNLPF